MRATLTDNDGTESVVQVPSQRAFSDYVIHKNQIYKRIGSSTHGEFQEVSGRVVTTNLDPRFPPQKDESDAL